ncbi:hypothetical protein AAHH21_13070 [Stenotrophomonas sp. BSUC-16]|uniref:hypothetical protein n=1 Tax=Stenotrophomonas sp. BSUC-16 TaxID=3156074 RepID=UPI003399D941
MDVIVGTEAAHREAATSLARIQQFDVAELPQAAALGTHLSFQEVVEPATVLIELFRRLSINALDDFPDQSLVQVTQEANNAYNLFSQILAFRVSDGNPQATRSSLIQSVKNSYPSAFQQLHPLIAYSLHRSADFQRLDAQARATLQNVEDKAGEFSSGLGSKLEEAEGILAKIREVAAEEGVSQMSVHFRKECEDHEQQAEMWRVRTVRLAIGLGLFAALSVFLHKIPMLKPESSYDTFQLGLSKVLIFAVITYMLVLSARNFMNHRHNAVVNKHRQNALMTHRAIVEGAGDVSARDAVMVHAASCIFSPQPTGYTNSHVEKETVSPRSIVEILSKPLGKE